MDLCFISNQVVASPGASYLTSIFRDSAGIAGLPYYSLKGHSFRIGAASVAVDAGLPDWLIKFSVAGPRTVTSCILELLNLH